MIFPSRKRSSPKTDDLGGTAVIGYLADRSPSRKNPYLFGLILLLVSTLAINLGQKVWLLIIGRFAQGASSGAVYAVGMAILTDAISQRNMGLAIGFVTLSLAAGMVLGPVAGGLLYHNFGYTSVFISAYVLIGLDFVLRLFLVERPKIHTGAPKPCHTLRYGTTSSEDLAHAACQAGGSKIMREEASRYENEVSTDSTPNTLNEESQLLPAHESPTRHPILELLSSKRMLANCLGDGVQSLILSLLEAILPLHIKSVFHYNSAQVALIFLLLSVPTLAGPGIGYITDKVGAKLLMSVGLIVSFPLLTLLRLIDHYDTTQVILLCVVLFAIGIAVNLILTPAMSDVGLSITEISDKKPGAFGAEGAYATAYGMMNMAFAMGALIGPLIGGVLMERIGWNWTTTGAGVLCAICVLPIMLCTGGGRREA